MFEATKLISSINLLSNDLRQDYHFFENILSGNKREDFIVDEVQKIIIEHGLSAKTRKQDLVHKRFYISHFLYRKLRLTLVDIGVLFNQSHSTILHGVNKHELYTEIKDIKYITDTSDIKQAFEDKLFEKFIEEKLKSKVYDDTLKFNAKQVERINSLSKQLDELKTLYS